MAQETPQTISQNYINFLKSQLNQEITVDIREAFVRLKGTMRMFDQFSNIILSNVVEYERTLEGKYVEGTHYKGNILVRGDSIFNITN
jgi:small nuclear ribonucleoprotein (snRNP)-like protein